MSLKLDDIKINEEYVKLVPSLLKEEYNLLKSSIRINGLYIPIIINEDKIILDGHHRFKFCKELDISPKFEVKKFANILLEKKFVIECNLHRRHLNDFQKSELGIPLQKINEELAEKNLHLSQGQGVKVSSNEERLNSNKQTSQEIGVSKSTFERAKKIIEQAPEELKEKVRKGETSINYAYKTINRQEKKKNAKPIPQGQYDVILADPPWKYEINTRGSPDDHYDVMEDKAISNLKIPASENCVLFMWGTAPKLPEALQVIEDWGFTYKTNMVWIKDKIGTGYYFRGKHELLFVAVKGSPLIPEDADKPESVLIAPRTTHSKKPDEVYGIIERMYPNAKYLELFARNTRNNWKSWGNEIDNE